MSVGLELIGKGRTVRITWPGRSGQVIRTVRPLPISSSPTLIAALGRARRAPQGPGPGR